MWARWLLPLLGTLAAVGFAQTSDQQRRNPVVGDTNQQPSRVHEDSPLLAELRRSSTTGIFVEVLSSARSCQVRVNGRWVLHHAKAGSASPGSNVFEQEVSLHGLYTVVVHPVTGRRTASAFSPGQVPAGGYSGLEDLLAGVQPGRVVVLCALGEAALSLDAAGQRLFRALNTSFAPDLQTRSMLALVAVKDGNVLAEGYAPNLHALSGGDHDPTLRLAATVPVSRSGHVTCSAPDTLHERLRHQFCSRYDGYRGLCGCAGRPLPPPTPAPFADTSRFPYPVVVVASNRPRYLYRCLSSLLANRGLDPVKVVVFSDRHSTEERRLLRLLDVTLHEHKSEPTGPRPLVSRIGFHYSYMLAAAFAMFPEADKLVVLEEDLEVSPDFISYFQQTQHLLDVDVSLYCISAWNDHGYNHSVGDVRQLYRVGGLPGLGWMLTRRLWEEELLPHWPDETTAFDWDMLVRQPARRRGRECVIPDVSRTYHFGFQGDHVGAAMQYKYYLDHALNTQPEVRLRDVQDMVAPRYTAQLLAHFKDAVKLDGTQSALTCTDIIPKTTPETPANQTYMLFIRMLNAGDTDRWLKVATCLNLWDLDARGDAQGVWRFWYNGRRVLVVGVPYSPLTTFAMTHGSGRALLYTGTRSPAQARRGRWPPGLPRPGPQDRRARFRMALAASGLQADQLAEAEEEDDEYEDEEAPGQLEDPTAA